MLELTRQTGWISPNARTIAGIGFLGAFTTFSTFGVETSRAIELEEWRLAGLNVFPNVVGGLLFVAAGSDPGTWRSPYARWPLKEMEGEQVLMRIFIGERDQWYHRGLADALVELFKKEGFAATTVLRGMQGFRAHSVIHRDSVLRLSEECARDPLSTPRRFMTRASAASYR